jgi:hypothetical protein
MVLLYRSPETFRCDVEAYTGCMAKTPKRKRAAGTKRTGSARRRSRAQTDGSVPSPGSRAPVPWDAEDAFTDLWNESGIAQLPEPYVVVQDADTGLLAPAHGVATEVRLTVPTDFVAILASAPDTSTGRPLTWNGSRLRVPADPRGSDSPVPELTPDTMSALSDDEFQEHFDSLAYEVGGGQYLTGFILDSHDPYVARLRAEFQSRTGKPVGRIEDALDEPEDEQTKLLQALRGAALKAEGGPGQRLILERRWKEVATEVRASRRRKEAKLSAPESGEHQRRNEADVAKHSTKQRLVVLGAVVSLTTGGLAIPLQVETYLHPASPQIVIDSQSAKVAQTADQGRPPPLGQIVRHLSDNQIRQMLADSTHRAPPQGVDRMQLVKLLYAAVYS